MVRILYSTYSNEPSPLSQSNPFSAFLIGLMIGAKTFDKGFDEFEALLTVFVILPAVIFPAFVILLPEFVGEFPAG